MHRIRPERKFSRRRTPVLCSESLAFVTTDNKLWKKDEFSESKGYFMTTKTLFNTCKILTHYYYSNLIWRIVSRRVNIARSKYHTRRGASSVIRKTWHFNINEQEKFHAQLSSARKKFYNLGTWQAVIPLNHLNPKVSIFDGTYKYIFNFIQRKRLTGAYQ